MIGKVVSCSIALTLVTLVYGTKHEEPLAGFFDYYPGVGYYYFGTNRNWTYAQTDCSASKARLAVINSEEERQTIVSFLSKHTQDDYVYGGFTNSLETEYVTIEGIALKRTGYTKWETGKPSGSGGRCGGINTKTGELTDLPCNVNMSYVCELQLWTGYTYFEGIGYYKFHEEGKSWTDAYDICESEGAHLLVINSQAEADVAKQIYDEHPSLPNTDHDGMFHIGFRAAREELTEHPYNGTYLTIFGSSVSDLGYVKWSGVEPIVNPISYCGCLYRSDTSYFMMPCYYRLAFFCEKELQKFNRT